MKARILLIEDSEAQGNSLKRKLVGLGYEVEWTRSGIEGMKLSRTVRPDLVLLDVVMAGVDGFAVCRWLKTTNDTRDIPVVMLTSRNDVQDRVKGLNVGANDYISKSIADDEFEARIFAALRIRTSQAELRARNLQLEQAIQRVEELATLDPVTGLQNRHRFTDVLRHEFAATKRYGVALSCLVLDVDHFKVVNDKYGYAEGDAILREIAELLSRNTREIDLACRYDGERFAILLPHTTKENARVVAERILRCLRGHYFASDLGTIALTMSAGISSVRDVSTNDPEELLRLADMALYEAKSLGRDRIVTFSANTERPRH